VDSSRDARPCCMLTSGWQVQQDHAGNRFTNNKQEKPNPEHLCVCIIQGSKGARLGRGQLSPPARALTLQFGSFYNSATQKTCKEKRLLAVTGIYSTFQPSPGA
jgi:hypothetical protein